MGADRANDFQKELADQFVAEAHEWLQNIHVALDELEQGPAPEKHEELIGIMLAGLMNLGGSAATINFRDVMEASFSAVPFVEAIKDPLKAVSVQDLFALCRQLGEIQKALICATGRSYGEGKSGREKVAVCAGLSSIEFVQALQKLQEKRSSSIATGRNHIRNLIEQVEKQVQAGVERIDVTVIQGYLARVAEAEESFLKTIDERAPEIFRNVNALTIDPGRAGSDKAAIEASLKDIVRLGDEATRVYAGAAVVLLTGLDGRLTVVVQRLVHLAATPVESVKARLHVMGETIRQWVEYGRAERAAIAQLLPVSHS